MRRGEHYISHERTVMTLSKRFGLVALVIGTAVATLAIPSVAGAQGCSLCYQSAAAAGSHAIHALRNGILILMVPPAFICVAISYLAYRRRNLHNQNN
jgi:hypothetical protein